VVTRLLVAPESDRDLLGFSDGESRLFDKNFVGKRLALFEEFALPSMQRQILPPNAWLVAVDQRLEKDVNGLASKIPQWARLFYLARGDRLSDVVRLAVHRPAADVLTIRLDSDDQLAPDFIARAARHSRPNRGLNFRHGVQIFMSSGHIVHRSIRSNMAVGFRAGKRCDLNVHDFGVHSNVGRVARMVDVWTSQPMWLKVSHDSNIAYFRPNGVPVWNHRRVSQRFNFPVAGMSAGLRLRSLLSFLGNHLNQMSPRFARWLEARRSALRG
jgi:hypothetical protein